jgi:hypothetical protein
MARSIQRGLVSPWASNNTETSLQNTPPVPMPERLRHGYTSCYRVAEAMLHNGFNFLDTVPQGYKIYR